MDKPIQIIQKIETSLIKSDLDLIPNTLMQLLQTISDGHYLKNSLISATSSLFEIRRKEFGNVVTTDELRIIKNATINQILNCFKELKQLSDDSTVFNVIDLSPIEEAYQYLENAKSNIELFESTLLKFLRIEMATKSEIEKILSVKNEFFKSIKKFKKTSNEVIRNGRIRKMIEGEIKIIGKSVELDNDSKPRLIITEIVRVATEDYNEEVIIKSFEVEGKDNYFEFTMRLLISNKEILDDISHKLLLLETIKIETWEVSTFDEE